MSDPLTVFTRIINEAFNAGNLDVLDELVSPDFVEHQFETSAHPRGPVGPAGVARTVRELRRSADDIHLAIADSSLTGDTVWVRLRGTGTDTGGRLGRRPTGRGFEITVIDIARVVDGKMVEHWGVPDRLGLLQQIGGLEA